MFGTPKFMNTYTELYILSGFYPGTFLQLVNGSKNSILNLVMKLNLFKSLAENEQAELMDS